MAQISTRLRLALGPHVRRARKQLDNPEVQAARRLLARVRDDPADVVHFGASESLFVAPHDADQRTLPVMLADALAPVSVHSVAGPGYQPSLIAAYARLLAAYPQRPVVVIGLVVRIGFPAWREHPAYSYRREAAAVGRIDPKAPLWSIRRPMSLPTRAELEAHDRRVYPTLAGELTVGDYRIPLKDPAGAGLSSEEATRLLYAYHYGAVIQSGDPWLGEVTALGRTLHELGFPVVIYQIPAPVDEGVAYLGPELRERVAASWRVIDAAFLAGCPDAEIVPTGLSFTRDHFIDPADATEHVNQLGRSKIADATAQAVRRVLASPGAG